jgi:hypothetical protein
MTRPWLQHLDLTQYTAKIATHDIDDATQDNTQDRVSQTYYSLIRVPADTTNMHIQTQIQVQIARRSLNQSCALPRAGVYNTGMSTPINPYIPLGQTQSYYQPYPVQPLYPGTGTVQFPSITPPPSLPFMPAMYSSHTSNPVNALGVPSPTPITASTFPQGAFPPSVPGYPSVPQFAPFGGQSPAFQPYPMM